MVLLNQHVDAYITCLPICNSLDMQWLQGTHTAHQLHEGAPCLQPESGVAAQTDQDTGGVPPYLRRKLTRRGEWTSCKASGGTTTMLDGAVSDGGGDWIQSDYSDEDEAQQLGVGRVGEYPPRVRWLRKRHLMTLRMAVKCSQQDSRTVLARPQIRDPYPPRSGKRNGSTETTSYDSNNESKRRRCSGSAIQRVEGLIGGVPVDIVDGAGVVMSCREAAQPPVTGHFSEEGALGPRRSQRLRKLGSAYDTRTYQ